MKKFILLTAITNEQIAIRPSDIIHIEECNTERRTIIVKTTYTSWRISAEKHSIESILKEIQNDN